MMSEFIKYLQSVVKSCSGFTKTDGNFLHIKGCLYTISDDYTVITKIKIPLEHDVIFGGNINYFNNLETEDELENAINIMSNILGNSLLLKRLWDTCKNYEEPSLLFANRIAYEEDCFDIPGFITLSNSPFMSPLTYITNNKKYMLYISKWLLPINKGDTCKLAIYSNYGFDTVVYTIHKKKLKLDVQIIYNIIPYTT